MHPNTEAVRTALQAAGAAGEIRELPGSARTATLAADLLGVSVGAVANSLIFDVGGSPLLIMTSGGHRVDTARVARLLGVPALDRADPEFVRRHTGQPIGGVAPLGHPAPIGTLVDIALSAYDVIWAAAGHPATVFPTDYAELLRLTAGTPAEVGD
ncbi:MAG: YbaK/EbsC family protein [Geodermatophilaceae bacterium]